MGFIVKKFIAIVEGFLKASAYLVRDLILGILQFINVFVNIQWNKNLNVFQNALYNGYFPNTEGKPSMHTTLVFFASFLTFLACMFELKKFSTEASYSLSTGFWTVVVGISGLIVTAFTTYARKKMSSEQPESAPVGEDTPPDPEESSSPSSGKISASFKEDVPSKAKKKISKKPLKKDSSGQSSQE